MIARTPGRDYVWPRRLPAGDEQIGEYMLARRTLTRGEGYIQTSTFFVRRSLMLAQPFKSGQLKHQDTEWVLRMGRVPGTQVVFAEQVLAIHNIEEERATVSNKSNWQYSLAWVQRDRHLFTPRALSGFVLYQIAAEASDQGEWRAFSAAAVRSPAPWQKYAPRLCHLPGDLAAAPPPPPPLARLDGAPPRASCPGAFAMKILQLTRQFLPAAGRHGERGRRSERGPAAKRAHGPGGNPAPAFFDRRLAPAESVEAGLKVHRMRHWGPRRYPVAPAALRAIRGYDLVHIHAIDFFVDYLSLLRWLHRIPLVVSTHGGFFHTQRARAFKEMYFKTVTRQSLGGVEAVVCVSQHDREVFSQDCASGAYPRDRERSQHRWLLEPEKKARSPGLVLGISRLAENKRVHKVLEAMAC